MRCFAKFPDRSGESEKGSDEGGRNIDKASVVKGKRKGRSRNARRRSNRRRGNSMHTARRSPKVRGCTCSFGSNKRRKVRRNRKRVFRSCGTSSCCFGNRGNKRRRRSKARSRERSGTNKRKRGSERERQTERRRQKSESQT